MTVSKQDKDFACSVIRRVWNYIAEDAEESCADNLEAIETCIDADWPTMVCGQTEGERANAIFNQFKNPVATFARLIKLI